MTYYIRKLNGVSIRALVKRATLCRAVGQREHGVSIRALVKRATRKR